MDQNNLDKKDGVNLMFRLIKMKDATRSKVACAFKKSDTLAQLGFIVSAVEDLLESPLAKKSQYYPWKITRTLYPRFLRTQTIEPIFSQTAGRAIACTRLVSSFVIVANSSSHIHVTQVARVLQAGTQLYQTLRSAGLGQDGADQALIVEQAAQLAYAFSKEGSKLEKSATYFLGAQAILSYFVSGYVKLISPVWRSGEAMVGITRTASYGGRGVDQLMAEYPKVRKIAAWSVIVSEIMAPAVPFFPRPARISWQTSMVTMHILIAALMGLNRFMWAFSSFHPILDEAMSQWREIAQMRVASVS
jgi:hypothetical protein